MSSLLAIDRLSVSVEGTTVVSDFSLTMHEGEVHALMGPNGSGKSSLVHALMGHPHYEITGGTVTFRNQDLFALEPHERSQLGLFLAFQYPRELTGVSLRSFLFAAQKAHEGGVASPIKFQKYLNGMMQSFGIDPSFAERSVNEGFSGGERKKAEVLQLAVLQPALALLDETDSGLDVDALRIVATGIQDFKKEHPTFSAIVVTHYARILDFLLPDAVHIMKKGSIIETGDASLANRVEESGYDS